MNNINQIIAHEEFIQLSLRLEELEKDRIFCKHDRKHFLDVARLAYLYYLEDKYYKSTCPYETEEVKEILYAAALLHDLGRVKELEEGIDHHVSSLSVAEIILKDTGFSPIHKEEIKRIIASHRNSKVKEEVSLAGIFYRADKESRECFWCNAIEECKWSEEKKNKIIKG